MFCISILQLVPQDHISAYSSHKHDVFMELLLSCVTFLSLVFLTEQFIANDCDYAVLTK